MEEILPPNVNIFLASLKILDEQKYTNIVLALVMVGFYIAVAVGNVFNSIQMIHALPSILPKCLLTADICLVPYSTKQYHLLEFSFSVHCSLTIIFLVIYSI